MARCMREMCRVVCCHLYESSSILHIHIHDNVAYTRLHTHIVHAVCAYVLIHIPAKGLSLALTRTQQEEQGQSLTSALQLGQVGLPL